MDSISDIARRLADNAEAVCRRYLSQGHREGRYWLVGNARNTPGRSLYVRLVGSSDARGQAGKWTDAESGEHGDLLDIIAASCGHSAMRETLSEARRFLSLPIPLLDVAKSGGKRGKKLPAGTPEAAKRLWRASMPIAGSAAAKYLGARGIGFACAEAALRFHPHCYYRASSDDAPTVRTAWPALIAAVTDEEGSLTGVHRTWLDPSGGKAAVAYPRRAMGHLLGQGVRFGLAGAVMVAGEGLETVLSLRMIAPTLPMIASLSAAHLAAFHFPRTLRRLYVACDNDAAGLLALRALVERASPMDIEILALRPVRDDFNTDLLALGTLGMRAHVAGQLVAGDREHWLPA